MNSATKYSGQRGDDLLSMCAYPRAMGADNRRAATALCGVFSIRTYSRAAVSAEDGAAAASTGNYFRRLTADGGSAADSAGQAHTLPAKYFLSAAIPP